MEYKICSKITIPDNIKKIYNVFKNSGYKFYLVGGAVRDILLNTMPNDYDCVTDALPHKIIELLNLLGCKIYDKGIKFGVISCSFIDLKVEICTFRKDITDERLPEVKLNPEIIEDAYRRDITYNALYYDIEKETILDYVNGIEDMQNKITKIVGDPYLRIKQDKLRILRVVRYACKYDHVIDLLTKEAILNSNLEGISKERIYDEIIRAFNETNFNKYLDYYEELKIFRHVFPNFKIENDKKINSNFIEIILAYILRNNDNIEEKLNGLKYDKKICLTTKLLIDLINFDVVNLQDYYKLKKRVLNNNNILEEWIEIMNLGDKQKKFLKYKPVTTKEIIDELKKEGYIGKKMSDKIKEIEIQYFMNL